VEEMNLKVGEDVAAFLKLTELMIQK